MMVNDEGSINNIKVKKPFNYRDLIREVFLFVVLFFI